MCADKVNIHSLNFTEHLLSARHGAITRELLVNRTDSLCSQRAFTKGRGGETESFHKQLLDYSVASARRI